jgi:membrane fusion protein (multidrug efflux system)
MRWLPFVLIALATVAGCGRHKPQAEERGPVQVTVMTLTPRDTPVSFEYVGQTQSSHQVEIRARVNGFLDRRVYTEGAMVKAGDVMFQQDPRPFRAQLRAAEGALAEQEARLKTANDNLSQVKPLAALNALSQKDLDDATGQQQAAAAAVQTALNRVRFDMNCPSATGQVPSRQMLQPISVRFGVERAEYTVGVEGCGQRQTIVVVCPQDGSGCSARGPRDQMPVA